MLLKVFIILWLIQYVLLVDPSHSDLAETNKSCSKVEYYDSFNQKCQEFPGGGYLVIVDHSAKCTNGDSGLHTFNRNDFYYLCGPDGIMIGMCPTDMKFNETLGRCVLPTDKPQDTIRIYDESENCNIMIPNCNKDGKFPVPSNCSFYYDCQRNNRNYFQYVYRCPYETMYHPDLHRCVTMTRCYIEDQYLDVLDHFDSDYFPKCIVQGQFRTSRYCNLFYRCIPNMDGSFFQIRYECPPMMYYNSEKERCYTGYHTFCEYISWDKIIQDYITKHNLKIDNYIPKETTTISTLNTTIATSFPRTGSSATEISLSYSSTYPVTYTTASTKLPRTKSSTYRSTSKLTSDKSQSSTLIGTSYATNSESSSISSNKTTEYQTTTPYVVIKTHETTIQARGSSTIHYKPKEAIENQTSQAESSQSKGTDTTTLKTRYFSTDNVIPINTTTETAIKSTSTKLATNDNTTKNTSIILPTTNGINVPTTSTQRSYKTTSFPSNRTTTKVTPTSQQLSIDDATETSTRSNNTTSNLPTLTTEDSNTSVSYTPQLSIIQSNNVTSTTKMMMPKSTTISNPVASTSQQPTVSSKHTPTYKDSSSEDYESYEDFTWDDVAWHRSHKTSKLPSGYPTQSTKKPRAHFHSDPAPFDLSDFSDWDSRHSHNATNISALTSDGTLEPVRNGSDASSLKPIPSQVDDSDSIESTEFNSRPVRCYNNRHGGLTCDGVKGKSDGWFELPGYLLRFKKRSGENDAPSKKMNGELNLRLRYPNAYKLEAYPKRKRRIQTMGKN